MSQKGALSECCPTINVEGRESLAMTWGSGLSLRGYQNRQKSPTKNLRTDTPLMISYGDLQTEVLRRVIDVGEEILESPLKGKGSN